MTALTARQKVTLSLIKDNWGPDYSTWCQTHVGLVYVRVKLDRRMKGPQWGVRLMTRAPWRVRYLRGLWATREEGRAWVEEQLPKAVEQFSPAKVITEQAAEELLDRLCLTLPLGVLADPAVHKHTLTSKALA